MKSQPGLRQQQVGSGAATGCPRMPPAVTSLCQSVSKFPLHLPWTHSMGGIWQAVLVPLREVGKLRCLGHLLI